METTHQQRVDLVSFKEKLRLVLKGNANAYWDYLKRYTQSKLTKRELDMYARSVLGSDENIGLHNLFVMSILHNAYCPYGPPLPATGPMDSMDRSMKSLDAMITPSSLAKEAPPPAAVVDNKKRKRTAASSSKGAKGAIVKENSEMEMSAPGSIEADKEAADGEDGKEGVEEGVLPAWMRLHGRRPEAFDFRLSGKVLGSGHLLALRNRLHRTAADAGLHHVDLRCVDYMMNALQLHLEAIVKQMARTPRVIDRMEAAEGVGRVKMGVEDLLDSVVAHPDLMGEDLSINLERIGFALDPRRH